MTPPTRRARRRRLHGWRVATAAAGALAWQSGCGGGANAPPCILVDIPSVAVTVLGPEGESAEDAVVVVRSAAGEPGPCFLDERAGAERTVFYCYGPIGLNSVEARRGELTGKASAEVPATQDGCHPDTREVTIRLATPDP